MWNQGCVILDAGAWGTGILLLLRILMANLETSSFFFISSYHGKRFRGCLEAAEWGPDRVSGLCSKPMSDNWDRYWSDSLSISEARATQIRPKIVAWTSINFILEIEYFIVRKKYINIFAWNLTKGFVIFKALKWHSVPHINVQI